jgi:hypothetical protein
MVEEGVFSDGGVGEKASLVGFSNEEQRSVVEQ